MQKFLFILLPTWRGASVIQTKQEQHFGRPEMRELPGKPKLSTMEKEVIFCQCLWNKPGSEKFLSLVLVLPCFLSSCQRNLECFFSLFDLLPSAESLSKPAVLAALETKSHDWEMVYCLRKVVHHGRKRLQCPAEDVITGYKCTVIPGQSLLADPAHSELSHLSLELIHSFSSAALSLHLKREDHEPSLILFPTN